MTKKAQLSTLQKFVIAVVVFVVLAYFIGMLFGALPNPAEIIKSIFKRFI